MFTLKLQNILQIYAQFVFVVVGGKSIYIYPSRLLHWHWGNRKMNSLYNHHKTKHNQAVAYLGGYTSFCNYPSILLYVPEW